MSKSNYLENVLLDYVLGSGLYCANVSVALYTTTPSDASAGTEVSTSGTGYSQITLANNFTNWPMAVAGEKTNGTQILFDSATGDWGEVKGFAIFDDNGTPRMLLWGDLSSDREVLEGDRPYFDPGELTYTED